MEMKIKLVQYCLIAQLPALENIFIELNGLLQISALFKHSSDEVIVSALMCMQQILANERAQQSLHACPEVFSDLAGLLDINFAVKCRLKASEVMVWLFKGLQINALKVFSAASKQVAAQRIKSPFVDFVINLGKDCPIQLRYVTVQLLNVLLSKPSDELEQQRFLASLENIGIYDALRSISKDAATDPRANAPLLQELKALQQAMKQIISGSSFELAIHKDRLKVLEKQLIEVQRRNAHYIEQ